MEVIRGVLEYDKIRIAVLVVTIFLHDNEIQSHYGNESMSVRPRTCRIRVSTRVAEQESQRDDTIFVKKFHPLVEYSIVIDKMVSKRGRWMHKQQTFPVKLVLVNSKTTKKKCQTQTMISFSKWIVGPSQ